MNRLLDSILNVRTTDPDDFRRRKLLNIILLGLSIVSLIATILAFISPAASPQLPVLGAILVAANAVLYLINRFASGRIASMVFILLLVVIISFGDAPDQVVQGRTLFFLSVPIIASSILLPASGSFLVAGVVSLISAYLSVTNGLPVNTLAILGFFTVAFGTWISSRSLETALEELRSFNRILDQRVAERTAELEAANERLKELDRLKTKFVSDVSHELRTPVSNLTIYLDILESGSRPDQRERFMRVLREETDRLTMLVNDVLDLSHVDLGAYRAVTVRNVDLNKILEKLVESQRLRASVMGLTLIVQLHPEPVYVRGTQEQLTRIASNLLGNAMKYTSDGQVEVRTEQSGMWALLTIQDTGVGIGEKDLPHIFDRFYRGESVSQSTIPGSGLGLAIAKELVELLGGTIEIVSEEGQGTRVHVRLPAVRV